VHVSATTKRPFQPPVRAFPSSIFLDQNRRDIGKSQSKSGRRRWLCIGLALFFALCWLGLFVWEDDEDNAAAGGSSATGEPLVEVQVCARSLPWY
jgi:hypothetical protein